MVIILTLLQLKYFLKLYSERTRVVVNLRIVKNTEIWPRDKIVHVFAILLRSLSTTRIKIQNFMCGRASPIYDSGDSHNEQRISRVTGNFLELERDADAMRHVAKRGYVVYAHADGSGRAKAERKEERKG